MFTEQWQITHKTSSPYYPKSNGLVERTIGTVKNIYKKCKQSGTDIYFGLLLARNTPKSNGIPSPSNLLMSRNLRCNIPMSNFHLKPKTVSYKDLQPKFESKQKTMKSYHDRHSRTLPSLVVGEKILFKHQPNSNWVPATVITEIVPSRTYKVKTPEGIEYTRNREHILKPILKKVDTETPVSLDSSSCQTPVHSPATNSGENNHDSVTSTPRRSQREKRRPIWFHDYEHESK